MKNSESSARNSLMQLLKVTSVAVSLIFTVLTSYAQQRPAASSQIASAETGSLTPGYGNAPLIFETNQGQTDSQVKFLSQGKGYSVFLTSGSMILSLRPTELTHAQETSSLPVSSLGTGRSAIRQMEKTARTENRVPPLWPSTLSVVTPIHGSWARGSFLPGELLYWSGSQEVAHQRSYLRKDSLSECISRN